MEFDNISDFTDESTNGFYKYKILVEGDSWVSHPFPQATNIATQLDGIAKGDVNILNFGSPGKEALNVLDKNNNDYKNMQSLLDDPANYIKFDLIILSIGGNDIVGPEIVKQRFVKDKNASANKGLYGGQLVSKHYYNKMSKVIDRYKNFIDMKNSSRYNKDTPVITHTYGYLKPRKLGTWFLNIKFSEGWVRKHLEELHIIEEREQYHVMKGMLDSYTQRLNTLERETDNFHVIDTRKLLLASNKMPDMSYWYDEIHPSNDGFEKVGKYIYSEIQKLSSSPLG